MNKRERCTHNLFTRIQVELDDRATVKGSKQYWLNYVNQNRGISGRDFRARKNAGIKNYIVLS